MHRLINFIDHLVIVGSTTDGAVGTLDQVASVVHGLGRVLMTLSVGLLLSYAVIVLGAMVLARIRGRARTVRGRHAATALGSEGLS